jgi:arginine utilization protein RocB
MNRQVGVSPKLVAQLVTSAVTYLLGRYAADLDADLAVAIAAGLGAAAAARVRPGNVVDEVDVADTPDDGRNPEERDLHENGLT